MPAKFVVRKMATIVLAMAILHYVLYGLTLSLQRETVTPHAAKGQETLSALRRTLFAAQLPSVLMLFVTPFLDMSGPLARWIFVALSVIVCGSLINFMLGSDAQHVENITGDEILSRSVVLPALLATLGAVDAVVDTFMVGLPTLWFVRAPAKGLGSVIAMVLPALVDEPIGGLLAQVYGLLFVVLCAAAIGAYFQPRDFIPPSSATLLEPPKLRPSASSDNLFALGERARSYKDVWMRVGTRLYRTPLMPWWITLAALSPALTAPARFRIAAASSHLTTPIVYWGKPIGYLVSFYVAKHLIVEKKQIGLLFTAFMVAALGTIAIPEIAQGFENAFLWVLMDSLICLFDAAVSYITYSVTAALGKGCATTLLALQVAIFTVGETFFIEITLWLTDRYSVGCEPSPLGTRICTYDAYPEVTRNVCIIGLVAMTILYLTGTMTRCFFVGQDEGWRDAGRDLKRARTVVGLFLLVAFVTGTSFFIVVFG